MTDFSISEGIKKTKEPSPQLLKSLVEYYKNGQFEDAKKQALFISEHFPKHQLAWKVLGVIFGQSGRKIEAVDALQKALALIPKDYETHNNLGITLLELGRLNDALASFTEAIKFNPNYSEAHYNLGITLHELGRLQDAVINYTKAITLNQDHAKAHNNLGIALHKLGKLSEATEKYDQAILIKPNFAEAYYNLGLVLKEQGNLKEAESNFSKAISYKPDYVEAHNNLGITFKKRGKLEDAVKSYTKAISLKSDYAEAHNNLGNAFQEQSKLDDATESYKKAIKFKSDFADAYWNLHGIQKTIQDAEYWIDKCLIADKNHVKARLMKAALSFYQGDSKSIDSLLQTKFKQHSYMRSFTWAFGLSDLPKLHFNKWYFFDDIIKKSITSRPFYEFGVWQASSFNYLIKFFKKGYGFDTFTGLPEDWYVGSHVEKKGSYPGDGTIPNIKGGEFIAGKFEDTLPVFFSESRPTASIINFDADLYSSTICALNYSKSVIDKDTILIFDEFIINESWEHDEFKALNEFCSINQYNYEVIAISFFTKQVAVKLTPV